MSDEIEYSWGIGGTVYKTEEGDYLIEIPAMPTVPIEDYTIALDEPANQGGWFTFRLSPKPVSDTTP